MTAIESSEDFRDVREALQDKWPPHVLNEVELEYRRLRLMIEASQETGEDVCASGLVAVFANVHAGASGPDVAAEKGPSSATAEAYRTIFGRPLPHPWDAVEKGRDPQSGYFDPQPRVFA